MGKEMAIIPNPETGEIEDILDDLKDKIRIAMRRRDKAMSPAGLVPVISSNQLAALLNEERTKSGLSRDQLGGAVNIGPSTIEAWERGSFRSIESLIRILRGLGCRLCVETVEPAPREPQRVLVAIGTDEND